MCSWLWPQRDLQETLIPPSKWLPDISLTISWCRSFEFKILHKSLIHELIYVWLTFGSLFIVCLWELLLKRSVRNIETLGKDHGMHGTELYWQPCISTRRRRDEMCLLSHVKIFRVVFACCLVHALCVPHKGHTQSVPVIKYVSSSPPCLHKGRSL